MLRIYSFLFYSGQNFPLQRAKRFFLQMGVAICRGVWIKSAVRPFYNKKNVEKERLVQIMKNIKKLLAALLAALLCVSVTACANNSASSTAVATLETSSTASEGETAESTDKDPAGYDDDIQGLCKYLEDCKVAAAKRCRCLTTSSDAENGYKYVYRYADSAVALGSV